LPTEQGPFLAHHLAYNRGGQQKDVGSPTKYLKICASVLKPAEYPGGYRVQHSVIQPVLLLSLNELSDEAHNVWVKCFASQKQVKKPAFKNMEQLGFIEIANELKCFINGLMELWFGTMRGGKDMSMKLTPEDVTELGKQVG